MLHQKVLVGGLLHPNRRLYMYRKVTLGPHGHEGGFTTIKPPRNNKKMANLAISVEIPETFLFRRISTIFLETNNLTVNIYILAQDLGVW